MSTPAHKSTDQPHQNLVKFGNALYTNMPVPSVTYETVIISTIS